MKKLLLLLFISLLSKQGLALDDIVLFCVETQKQTMLENNIYNRQLSSIKFEIEGDFVILKGSIFGDKDSFYPQTKLDIHKNNSYEFVARSFGRTLVYYEDSGILIYSDLDMERIEIVFAKCKDF